MKNLNIIAIVQARCGSTRLPNKIFLEISEKPLLWHIINRLNYSKYINKLIVATTINEVDNKVERWCSVNNIACFRGSENDVLDRFYHTARKYNADIVVRITADDPFKDPKLIDNAIKHLISSNADFVCNNHPPTYPEGLDVEVFTMRSLEIAMLNSNSTFEREHVTQYFYRNPDKFHISNLKNNRNLSNLRWTIDTEEDYLMAKEVYNKLFNKDSIFMFEDIINLIKKYPEITQLNNKVPRSELYKNL